MGGMKSLSWAISEYKLGASLRNLYLLITQLEPLITPLRHPINPTYNPHKLSPLTIIFWVTQ